jgi:hypothetical protein
MSNIKESALAAFEEFMSLGAEGLLNTVFRSAGIEGEVSASDLQKVIPTIEQISAALIGSTNAAALAGKLRAICEQANGS